MTGSSHYTKSPKSAMTFCNRVTMETWLLLDPGGVGVNRKRVSRWGEGIGEEGRTMNGAVPKIVEGGDEL